MSERLLLAAPVVALALITLWAARRRSPLEPTVLAVGITAVIACFFPIASAFISPMSWRHGVHLPDEFVLGAQVQYVWFMTGMCAVIARIRFTRGRPGAGAQVRERSAAQTVHRDHFVAFGLVVGGGLLYSLYIAKVGLGPLIDRSNFAEKYRVSSGLGPLYAGLNLMILGCVWAEASELPRRTLRLFRLCAIGILVWSVVFIAIRTYAVALLLSYLYIYTKRRGFTVAQVRPSLILALALGYIGVEGYGLLRSVWHGSMSDALVTLQSEMPKVEQTLGQIVGGSELSHPFLTMMELERYEEPGDLGGSSYAHGVVGMAPLWLVPDRGTSVAQDFASNHYPELADRGGGTAFCFVGEAWWNFGSVFGPLLLGLAFGWLLMWAERAARLDPSGIVPRFLPYTLHWVLLIHRNSFAGLLKQTSTVAIPVALLLVAAALIWAAVGTRAHRIQPLEAA